MTMPNFLIIGAAKSGTTSLYHYLGQHPQVYTSPVKEPRFFALEGEKLDFHGPGDQKALRGSVTDIETYRGLFAGVSDEIAVGEASPLYMYSAKAPGRIERHIPEVKLVAILRNPAERAYSGFLHLVRDGLEPLDNFGRALEAEEDRIRRKYAPHWWYREGGFYHAQLSRYFQRFDRERIRVYLHEDLKADPAAVLRDLFGFLGVDERFVPNLSARHNVGGVPGRKRLHALVTAPHPLKTTLKPFVPRGLRKRVVSNLRTQSLREPPPLSPEVRRELIEVYREDILNLQDLIQRDLSRWLE